MFRIFLAALVCACFALPTAAIAQPAAKAAPAAAKAKIDPNTATPAELITLPGIGKKKAELIIAGRPYKTVEDLLGVKGIGKKTLEKLKPLIEIKAALPPPPKKK